MNTEVRVDDRDRNLLCPVKSSSPVVVVVVVSSDEALAQLLSKPNVSVHFTILAMQTEEQADKNTSHSDELFDLLTEEGKPTGRRKERKKVHRDGKQASKQAPPRFEATGSL